MILNKCNSCCFPVLYAHQQHLNVKLWTGGTGLVQGEHVVLEALAATEAGEELSASAPLKYPLIWLSQNPLSLSTLPSGSRWWPSSSLSQKYY